MKYVLVILILSLLACTKEDDNILSKPEELMELWHKNLVDYSYYTSRLSSSFTDYQSIGEMFYSLDDTLKGVHYTHYVEESDAWYYRDYSAAAPSRIFGAIFGSVNDTLVAQKVFAGSGASQAGLVSGDQIVAVDSFDIHGNSAVFDAVTEGNGPFSFVVVRDSLVDTLSLSKSLFTPPLSYSDSLTENVGYIYLSSFMGDSETEGGSSSEQFGNSLYETRDFPVTILDLRDNGGGYVDECLNIASEFLVDGDSVILVKFYDYSSSYEPLVIDNSAISTNSLGSQDREFVLLANERSASASEMLITALQHNLGSPLVGVNTYGKAMGQYYLDYETSGEGLGVITYATFATPAGLKYQSIGIEPDHFIRNDDDSDKQLLKAIEVAESLLPSRKSTGISDGIELSAIQRFNSTLFHTSPQVPEYRTVPKK